MKQISNLRFEEVIWQRPYELENVWDESKRLVNPHKIYVDLSKELWETKNRLLEEEH